MKQYKLLNNSLGWMVFIISAIVYTLTLEPTASFWDCGEFISSGYKLEVGHPPGNPIFMLTARFFANFASGPDQVAYMVNFMSGLLSAGTILLLFWTITRLAKIIVVRKDETMNLGQMIAILGSGLVGALVFAFSDTFWFSAVEGEVYAYSSFCTAIVFWLILKWEEVADQPHADRYIVLIAYLMGVSIAVHLLNLLCIPAIVLIYYYRKYPNTNLKGSIIALIASFALVALLLYGLIPGFVKVTGWFELLCVNKLGMSYNVGTFIYFLLVIATLVWGLVESHQAKSDIRTKLSFILAVSMLGIPFIGSGVIIGLVLIIALSIYLFTAKKLPVKLMNMGLVSLMVIFIGYSSYALILIRSNANTPMDQNSPQDIFTLGRYLNREQYGDRPLLYGYTFVSDVQRDSKGGAVTTTGAPIYSKAIPTGENSKDKYVVAGYKTDYVYNPDLNMLFTRMHSKDHAEAYKSWTKMTGKKVRTKGPDGSPATVTMPTFGENLKFFFSYQLNYMYWRYFMWNFSGRQNDIQGDGGADKGNWITGFNFIDKYMVGDAKEMPEYILKNEGRNYYYMLPLILGIIGLLFQAYSGKKGIETFWATFFLFFMTGIAIVIYLNQTPMQPRERDYAYVGSFYAFAIWVGLGVAALAKGGNKFLKPALASSLATLLCLAIPIQMIGQNWDDHDRSGRYVARDFGKNYLTCVEENGIIFTNGDNDTFPLWYVQETEGYRTDVRVCNLSYLQTDWYVDQMKSQAYESTPLPISMTKEQYSQGKRDYAYLMDMMGSSSLSLNSAMDWLLSENERTKKIPGINERMDFIPSKKLFMEINTSAIDTLNSIASRPDMKPDAKIELDYTSRIVLYKNDISILNMLNNINKEGWKRPIYFAPTIGIFGSPSYMGLEPYFSNVGFAYRITPYYGGKEGSVNTEVMYDNMVNKFLWGGMDDPNVYLDETCRRTGQTARRMFTALIDALIAEGKHDKALTALNTCIEKIPNENIPFDGMTIPLAAAYLRLGEYKKGNEILSIIGQDAVQSLRWYLTMTPKQIQGTEFGQYLGVLQMIARTYDELGLKAESQKYAEDFSVMYSALQMKLSQ